MPNKNESSQKNYKNKFELVFENAGDAMFIHGLKGNFLEVNKAACKSLGYAKKELLKMSPMDIDAPGFASKVNDRIKDLQKKGEVFFETIHVTKKGKNIPIELSSKIIDYEGQKAILSIARDISVRKKLLETRSRSEALFSVIPSAVFMVDINKKITSWNKAAEKITGFGAKEMIGEYCSKFALLPCNEGCSLFDNNKKKPVHRKECVIKKKNGKEIVISKNIDVIRNSKGEIIGGIESFEDITKIKQTENMLQEKIDELEKINQIMVGREKKMIELKKELQIYKFNKAE